MFWLLRGFINAWVHCQEQVPFSPNTAESTRAITAGYLCKNDIKAQEQLISVGSSDEILRLKSDHAV